MKPSLEILRGYERALEQLESVHFTVEYENRAVAVRGLEAWVTALNPREKAEPLADEEIPVSALEPIAYTAALEQIQTGGQA